MENAISRNKESHNYFLARNITGKISLTCLFDCGDFYILTPIYNEDKRSWGYKVEFHNFDGERDAACVIAIRKKGKLYVITVMDIKEHKK